MSIERNKQLTREFFTRFGDNDMAGVLDTLTEDVTWWIAGKPGITPVAGVQNKQQIARIFKAIIDRTTSGLHMTVKSAIAEGDQVAVEVEGHGVLRNGRIYNNEYHLLITFRDGKICAAREYLDTQHVAATFFHP